MPAYVTDEGEPYRPETLFWMSAEGAVLGPGAVPAIIPMEARSHPRGAGPTFDAPTRQPKGSYPQVVPESFTNDSKERWATDLKILFQRKDIVLPRDRELVGQLHSIKRRVLASGKVSFDAERTTRAATPIASGPSRSPARRNA